MIEYRVLGPLSVLRDSEPIPLTRPLERRLLAVLLVNRDRTLTDDQIIDALWAHDPPTDPKRALQSSVSRLRKIVGSDAAIFRQSGGYGVLAPPGSLDADLFENAIAAPPDSETISRLNEALDLWTSDVAYSEFQYDDFATTERNRLGEIRLNAMEGLFEARLDAGESHRLVPDIELQVKEHPFRERLYWVLMVALYRSGRQADALRTFRAARSRLGERLGIEPSRRLVELEERILLQDPTLDLEVHKARANNVPSRITSVLGRDGVVDQVAGHLFEKRLVSLVGPGGVGKTTIALEAARTIAASGRMEAWTVDLTPVRGPRLPLFITVNLAAAFQYQAPPKADTQALAQLLGARRMLLVLDNCEHVIAEVATLIRELLELCPRLTILASSRERLAVHGETVVEVDPLAAPASSVNLTDVAEARRLYPALDLFLDRAQAVVPGMTIDLTAVKSASRISRKLDGLPLALELAAARVGSMSLTDIEHQIDDRFTVLATQRGVEGRHQSLEAAIDWSYGLLDEQHQTLLQLLATVNGPFSVRDAACLLATPSEAAAAACLGLLKDRSLVRADVAAAPTTRYELLMTIREFARSRASQADKTTEHALRHAECFRALAKTIRAEITGGSLQLTWMTRIGENMPDFRQAIETFVSADNPSSALDVVAGIGFYWDVFRRNAEGYSMVAKALDAANGTVYPATPRVHLIAGTMYTLDGFDETMLVQGRLHIDEALRTAEILDDSDAAIDARSLSAVHRWLSGDFDEALAQAQSVRQTADPIYSSGGAAYGAMAEGMAEHRLDLDGAATSRLLSAVELAQTGRAPIAEAYSLMVLGAIMRDNGDYTGSASAYHESFLIARRYGFPLIQIIAAGGTALGRWLDGEKDDALRAAKRALSLAAHRPANEGYMSYIFLFLDPCPPFSRDDIRVRMETALRARVPDGPIAGLRFLLEIFEEIDRRRLGGRRTVDIKQGLTRLT